MKRMTTHSVIACMCITWCAAVPAHAQKRVDLPEIRQTPDGKVIADGKTFESWNKYVRSDFFRSHGLRCGKAPSIAGAPRGGASSDCTYTNTNPAATYDPSVIKYRIPVVVHVIRQNDGVTGNISPAMVQSQIDILNEDFLALPGTNGANGTDIQIEFYLATTDPGGSPTTGITYSNNTTWFNDGGNYWNSLAWDTNNYLNIYTNTAGGALGYVPDLPQGGIAGSDEDRVVVLWSSFGRNGPIGPPFDQGRTTTHEVGHYLGLEHTFTGGCSGSCYTSGDLICDTNAQANPTSGCSNANSCGSSDPIDNYMDYSDDTCMEQFTPEQARRMRCSLEHYRSQLWEQAGPATGACCNGPTCTVETQADCTSGGGSYQGDGSSCAANPCSTANGACCDPSGGCTIDTEFNCATGGGNYQGDSSLCSPNPCPVPTGACCATDSTCSIDTAANCQTTGGTYQGDGSSCSPDPCAPPGGGCGDPTSGSCSVANGSPFCDDAACCATVCAQDPYCCDTEWDQLCVDAAAALCGGGGGGCPGSGDCSVPNGTPGCDDEDCCNIVCAQDPFCCDTEWDDLCAEAAVELCGGGGGGCAPSCNKQNVECLVGTPEYQNRLPVGQMVDGTGAFCTAWLVAAPDIVMTNQHCVEGNISGVSVVFNAECDTCVDGNPKPTDTYAVIEIIHEDAALDYALLRLSGNPAATWGVAAVDDATPVIGQDIYEIHHGDGLVKGYDSGQVTSLDIPGTCIPGTTAEVGVNAIATGGASGAPIFSSDTHCVMAICHCGPPCSPGWGVPMSFIWPDALPRIQTAGGQIASGCGVTGPGDCNGDGTIDMADMPCFVNVLLGIDTDPNHVDASDTNTDGNTDGGDVQTFAEILMQQ